MAITELTDDLDIIAALDDEPNDVGGLTASQLKTKFDEGPNDIKDYLNDTHIPELDADHLPYIYGSANTIKDTIEDLTAGVMPDDSVTAAKLTADSVTLTKVASSVYASQAEAEAGTENTKFITSLRVKQAITEQGLKVETGTLTGVDFGVDQTATLSASPIVVFVRHNSGNNGYPSSAVLFDGNLQYLLWSGGTGYQQVSASLSGATLTLSRVDGTTSGMIFNYVAFYI